MGFFYCREVCGEGVELEGVMVGTACLAAQFGDVPVDLADRVGCRVLLFSLF